MDRASFLRSIGGALGSRLMLRVRGHIGSGQAAVRAFWDGMLGASPAAHFTTEEIFAAGDRCTVRWRYGYTSADGASGHIRGADIFRVRDGKVAEKLSYVKG